MAVTFISSLVSREPLKSGSNSTYINLSNIYFIYLCKNNKTVVSVVWNKGRLISNQENFEKSDIKALKWCKLSFLSGVKGFQVRNDT